MTKSNPDLLCPECRKFDQQFENGSARVDVLTVCRCDWEEEMMEDEVSGNDDDLVATIATECLQIMKGYPTVIKMTACYNLTERILRLFCIQGSKESMHSLMDEFNENLKKDVDVFFPENRNEKGE